ncbi:Rpn family recombination-promoting nuclease/putative transposase [Wolbachia endosymbiont (group A) of Bibio marci]|uniref:Rpn family recombination-promoting nuclease/putative transposase n=1 Tax=Wolbachia endosymbiont (group A) of Bibio marci TaxID=2953987 RepID=UPI0022308C79|nr:Rpn family recombination-promoting nuclease/putative transposase [Wolbachia endosymbiont (group A) of Bibio marci]
MKDKPVREKKNLDKGLKRSVGKPACCVSKGGSSSNTTSLPNQLARDKGFEKRAQYYAAKAYLRQADKGDQYHNLKEIIFIAIADCVLFPNKSEYKSKHTIRDEDTNEHDLKDFYFIFIELPKFPKNKEEQLESIVDRWLFFFKYADETTEEDLRKIAEKAPIIKLAYDDLDRFSWNEKDLIAYEERIMDLRKEEAILEYRLDLAEEKGIQIGEERGIKIGKEEGKIEVAKAMLANNVDVNTIVKFTGLSMSEIKELQN